MMLLMAKVGTVVKFQLYKCLLFTNFIVFNTQISFFERSHKSQVSYALDLVYMLNFISSIHHCIGIFISCLLGFDRRLYSIISLAVFLILISACAQPNEII